mgnify:FL=1
MPLKKDALFIALAGNVADATRSPFSIALDANTMIFSFNILLQQPYLGSFFDPDWDPKTLETLPS